MDKSEPCLVPEWLRSSGSAFGSGGSSHHFASSHSDGILSALSKRNKCSPSFANNDSHRSSFLDRNLSANSRSSSSNGSAKNEKTQYSRSYSGFNRSQRDIKRDKLAVDDQWDPEYLYPLRSIMTGRIEKEMLRRSQSLGSRKQSEVLQRKAYADLRSTGCSSHNNASALVSVHSMEKMAFERDFPSLGSEDRPITPDTMRVPSPGLSRSMQSLPISNSSLIGVDGWTSALAEVPVEVESNTAPSMLLQTAASSASAPSSTASGLNMAEALVQASLRSHTACQPSVENQKREELEVLQSMRLIPMTTSMPKNGLGSSDKLKPKTPRYRDQVTLSNNGHQLPSLQPASQLLRGASVKTDDTKTSHTGKLLVLKPGRESGASLAFKETSSPTGIVAGNFVDGQASTGTSASSVALKNPGNPKFSVSTKTSTSVLNSSSMADKKPSYAHAKSRSDFFNLMRKKSMNKSAVNTDSISVVSSDPKTIDECKEVSEAPASLVKNGGDINCNGDASKMSQGHDEGSDNGFSDNAAFFPDEEEAAFLRSLGWEENAGDEGGLTEEEINAFYQEYMKQIPASKLCGGVQLKILGQDEPQQACSGAPTSDFSTSETSA